MIYILISVCFSISVSVMLKLARRYHIDVYQAITWNYSAAIVLSWLFLKPKLGDLSQAPDAIYGSLGILLPLIFIVLAVSIKYAGIVRTDAAQRLSLFISVIASFIIFGESLSIIKIIGLMIGIIAVICLIPWKKQQSHDKKVPAYSWIYLLVVFIGFGLIDILFKQMASFKQISLGTSLFITYSLSFAVALIGLLFQVFRKTMKFSWPHILIGWVLGLANFGNILFYLKAHQALSRNPSLVFSSMNIGVIVTGTLVGMIIFKEKLTVSNKIGLALAVIAVLVIYNPQIFSNLFHH